MNNVYFYSENVCVRVYLMQNSTIGECRQLHDETVSVPGSSPGSAQTFFRFVFY